MFAAEGDSDLSSFVEGFAFQASCAEGTLQERFAAALKAGVQEYWNYHIITRNMHLLGDFDDYADVCV